MKLLQRSEIRELIPNRRKDSHKGDYGSVFILAGSSGLTGAAVLASLGALYSGCGLVTLGIPKGLNGIVAGKLTEVMTKSLPETKDGTLSAAGFEEVLDIVENKMDAIAIGPGLSQNVETQGLVRKLANEIRKPLVLDADGLNAFSGKCNFTQRENLNTVITPHPGEMARLIGSQIFKVQGNRIGIAQNFAKKHHIVVVLKGYKTVIASPSGEVLINPTGNPGMASGGIGDVLTGMIVSLIGQGIPPFDSAKIATYIHGLAGDIALKKSTGFLVTAGNLLENIQKAFGEVISK